MAILPTVRQLPGDGPMRLILVKAARHLRTHAAAEPESAAVRRAVVQVIEHVLDTRVMHCQSYFSRAWTVAERMARHGHRERLSAWLSLTAWLGAVLDGLLHCSAPWHEVQALQYTLGPDASSLLVLAQARLVEAIRTGSVLIPACQGLAEAVAELLEQAALVWAAAPMPQHAPTDRGWLCRYLTEDLPDGVYSATRKTDLVGAVYSNFCAKQIDFSSPQDVSMALSDMALVAQTASAPRGQPEAALREKGLSLPARVYVAVGLESMLPSGVLQQVGQVRTRMVGGDIVHAHAPSQHRLPGRA